MSRRAIVDLALLGLLVATAAAVALPAGSVRFSLVLASASLVPGAAVLSRFELEDPLIWAALAIALSLAIAIAGGLALAWTGFWHPVALGVGIGLVSGALLLADLLARFRGRVSTSSRGPVDGGEARSTVPLNGANALVPHESAVLQPAGPPLGTPPRRLRVTDHARYRHRLSARPSGVPLRGAAVRVPGAGARARLARLVLLVPLVFGAVCWGLALHSLDHVRIGTGELPALLPLTWWLSLVAVLGGAVAAACWGARRWVLVAYVAMLAVVLYATLPAVLDVPQYAWTYKHIGVVRLIELRGSTSPGVDIYNRWPGFFAAAAVVSQLGGIPNPVSYAAWSEPFFALVDALIVAALGWSIVRDRRIAGLAAVIFTAGNWVGQGYFSPQATAYPLALALLLIVTREFTLGRVGPRTVRAIERIARRRQLADWDRRAGGGWPSTRVAGALVLLLCAAIVATHQLTPYFLLLQVGALAVIGVLRPRWILPAMAVITIGYLIPNLKFVADWFGVFNSLDPFSNAVAGPSTGRPVAEPLIYQHAGQVLSLLFGAGALAAWIALARRGLGVRAAPLIVLAAAPVLLLFGQNYGGEASLRVFLFSAPWDAILIAWAAVELAPRRLSALPALTLCTIVGALFVPAFFGQASVNAIRPGEVAASEYFYAHAPAGSILVAAAPNFPMRAGPRYALMYGSQNDLSPTLLVEGRFANQPLGTADVPAVADFIRSYTKKGFLVFSTSQDHYATTYGLSTPRALADLEAAIARSPDFVLWYHDADARIYRLVSPAHASASPASRISAAAGARGSRLAATGRRESS